MPSVMDVRTPYRVIEIPSFPLLASAARPLANARRRVDLSRKPESRERSSERRICHSVLIGRHWPEQRCHDTRLRCPVGNEARQLTPD